MKDTGRKPREKRAGATRPAARPGAREKKEAAARQGRRTALVAAVAIVVIIAVIALIYFALRSPISVPFQTFKAGFDSARRVAVFVTYANQTQYATESPCFADLVQSIASSRNVSIDFYLMNQTNCTFSQNGLGHLLNGTKTRAASYCTALEGAEPSVILNYAPVNLTVVRASEILVYGNAAYMASCPIAIDMH
jgi:hypothetical protein